MILDKLQSTQFKHLCSAKRSHNARTHLSTLWPYGCMRNHRPLIRTQLTFKVWQGKVGGYDQSIDEEERNLPRR